MVPCSIKVRKSLDIPLIHDTAILKIKYQSISELHIKVITKYVFSDIPN